MDGIAQASSQAERGRWGRVGVRRRRDARLQLVVAVRHLAKLWNYRHSWTRVGEDGEVAEGARQGRAFVVCADV